MSLRSSSYMEEQSLLLTLTTCGMGSRLSFTGDLTPKDLTPPKGNGGKVQKRKGDGREGSREGGREGKRKVKLSHLDTGRCFWFNIFLY